ncbi:MAG: dipeptidase [Verrucomicrobia bacterium]|nr:dipeptidase [Verrucomicrobiota bacterium]MBI3870131.1 dipeptidase [Verrucomicrobiota bacterium]
MQQVHEYIQRNEAAFIAELCDYVRFPSVSAQSVHAGDLRRCAEWLVGGCARMGLEATLRETPGNPVVVARTPKSKSRGAKRKRFLVYGHYDVQPPEPLDLWKSPPFEPRIQGRNLYGRGASDNKGQNLAHLKAVEAYLKTGTELPCDITFVLEGEEEVGSSSLAGFLKAHRKELACDAVVISDTGIPSLKHPALTYGLRGIAAMEVRVHGPSRDLHSGIYGGSLDNPAWVLSRMLGRLRTDAGRVAIPGFYDRVRPLTRFERTQLARLPFSETAYRKFLGVPALNGEKGFTPIEQRCARPTLEINGLTSGYQGQGSKTIVPAWAVAKITMRLVPDQSPKEILSLAAGYLRKICPPTVRLEVELGHSGEPYVVSPSSPVALAGLSALRQAFGREPYLIREGGSIPIVNDFRKILGVDTLLLGLALPDDNLHSPNEKFNLDCFMNGVRMSAALWQELARI